jgi:hypothetical protein
VIIVTERHIESPMTDVVGLFESEEAARAWLKAAHSTHLKRVFIYEVWTAPMNQEATRIEMIRGIDVEEPPARKRWSLF